MSSSAARPERVYHQDYIARIRYSNALPPPPNPPKLLDIPNTGLASGQYTSAGFASRLVREQPLNIEADAELGMPIDLVGLPGVFDGDESAIHGLDNPPAPHPHDKALLRPLSTLGKPSSVTSGISFLRRTEYISSAAGGTTRYESGTSKDVFRKGPVKRKKQADVSKDDPIFMIRSIIKGFDIAYPQEAYTGPDTTTSIRGAEASSVEKNAWMFPRHPSKADVKLIDSYPLLPDLEAFTATENGAYQVFKFNTCPLPSMEKYDERLDVALLYPNADIRPEKRAEYEAQRLAHETNPNQPEPLPQVDYDLFLPRANSVLGIKRKYNVMDPENDDDMLYDEATKDSEKPAFQYERLRKYETYQQTYDPDVFGDTVALALHDGEPEQEQSDHRQKAAYLYPISQRIFVRPFRNVGQGVKMSQPDPDEEKIDLIDAVVGPPEEEDIALRERVKQQYDRAIAAS